MDFIEAIVSLLLQHFYTVSFIAGMLGEEAVLFLTFLASQNTMRLKIILFLAPLGIWIVDIAYFYLGRLGLMKKIGEKIQNVEYKKGVLPWLVRFGSKHPLCALIITKFVYGTELA